jgi:hypothetical protein
MMLNKGVEKVEVMGVSYEINWDRYEPIRIQQKEILDIIQEKSKKYEFVEIKIKYEEEWQATVEIAKV